MFKCLVQLLEAAGVAAQHTAVLGAADPRSASQADVDRIAGKLAKRVQVDYPVVRRAVSESLSGSLKQWANYQR